jgi:hypothetical protein
MESFHPYLVLHRLSLLVFRVFARPKLQRFLPKVRWSRNQAFKTRSIVRQMELYEARHS